MRILLAIVIFFTFTISSILLVWNEYQDFKKRHYNNSPFQKNVYTSTVPVQKQFKGIFELKNGISLSNNFDGARLNGVALSNDSLITVLITPENIPLKPNSWYAFKIWAKKERKAYLEFTYPDGVSHKYYPKLSTNGTYWSNLDSSNYFDRTRKRLQYPGSSRTNTTIKVNIGPDTLWIAAHEVISSKDTKKWVTEISTKPFVSYSKIGESHEERAINVVSIENKNATKNIIVLSRQYPSMSVGDLAMKEFIETIIDNTNQAKTFREYFNIYLFPNINPDGTDNGHWSHNSGGVNLSEDWGDFKQPETLSIKKYIASIAKGKKDNFYLNIDFRSNQKSILYVFNNNYKNNMRGLTMDIAEYVNQNFPGQDYAIKPRFSGFEQTKAEDFFYKHFGMESLVVVIDESSSKEDIKKRGENLALTVMQVMTNHLEE